MNRPSHTVENEKVLTLDLGPALLYLDLLDDDGVFTCGQFTFQRSAEAAPADLHVRSNRFDAVVRRVGRCVLIDESAFGAWFDAQNGGLHDQH